MEKRKILLTLVPFLLLTGCSQNGGSSEEEGQGLVLVGDQDHVAYADQETSGKFVFTASSDWTADISGSGVDASWLKLFVDGKESYAGSSGSIKLEVGLGLNYTGKDRTAEITVACCGEKVKLAVTQRAEKLNGKPLKLMRQAVYHTDGNDEIWTLDYDEKGRIVYCGTPVNGYRYTYHADESVVCEVVGMAYSDNLAHEATLNSRGLIEQWGGLSGAGRFKAEYGYTEDGYLNRYIYWDLFARSSQPMAEVDLVWENGNLVECGDIRYTYTAAANNQNLDMVFLVGEFDFYGVYDKGMALLGMTGKRSAKLVSTREQNGTSRLFRYDYDSDGYVVRVYDVREDNPKYVLWTINYY